MRRQGAETRNDMELTSIRNLFREKEKYLDQTVTVGGWLRSVRDSKTFGFLVVNDGTFFEPLQVVYADKLENFAAISKLNVGAAVIVTGKLVATPNAKQPFEIQADEVVVEGESAPDYPLQKSATPSNTFGRFPICVRGPIRSRRCSVCVP